eukprot:2496469-Pyramimonas_sp.AAC.1
MERCMEGNGFAGVTGVLVRQALRRNIPSTIENPATYMLWNMPILKSLRNSKNAKFIVFDQCQFGAEFRKRTSILMSSDFDDSFFDHKCTGMAGLCSRSNRPRSHLEGNGAARWMTDRAERYP